MRPNYLVNIAILELKPHLNRNAAGQYYIDAENLTYSTTVASIFARCEKLFHFKEKEDRYYLTGGFLL